MRIVYESRSAWSEARDAALKKYIVEATRLTRAMDAARSPKGTFRVPGGETVGAVCDVAQKALTPLIARNRWPELSVFLRGAAQTAWLALWRSGQLTPGRLDTSRRSLIESLAQTLSGNKIAPGFLDASVHIKCAECNSMTEVADMWGDRTCRDCSISVPRSIDPAPIQGPTEAPRAALSL